MAKSILWVIKGLDNALNEFENILNLFFKENVGFNVDQLYGTIHNQVSGGPGVGGNTYVKDMTNTFHTYKADWNSERIIFYVDDRAYFVSFKIQ